MSSALPSSGGFIGDNMDKILFDWVIPAVIAVGIFYLMVDILIKMIGPTYPAMLGF